MNWERKGLGAGSWGDGSKEEERKNPFPGDGLGRIQPSIGERRPITLWMDEAVLGGWLNTQKKGRRGVSNTYNDLAVQCMGTLRVLFRLPLRSTEGFTHSLFEMLGLSVSVPSYTQLCRRLRTLEVALPASLSNEPLHLVVDSTGLKVYGEGEWKVRQHGWGKRRTWRKLHLGFDAKTHEILCAMFTGNDMADCEAVADLLEQVEQPIRQFSGDGGCDASDVYEELARRKVQNVSIPPRKNARIQQHGNSKNEPLSRDKNLGAIRRSCRKKWKQSSGYHQRSKAETGVYRYKTFFGERLAGKTFQAQATDVFLGCTIINTFTHLGMPTSIPLPL